MTIKALLLDLDNTLYDAASCIKYATAAVLTTLEQRTALSLSELSARFAVARERVKHDLKNVAASHSRLLYIQKLSEGIIGRTDSALILELNTLFWKEYFAHMNLNLGVREVLVEFKQAGIKIEIGRAHV